MQFTDDFVCTQVSEREQLMCEFALSHKETTAKRVGYDDFAAVELHDFLEWVLNGEMPLDTDTNRFHKNVHFYEVLFHLTDGHIRSLNVQLCEHPVSPSLGVNTLESEINAEEELIYDRYDTKTSSFVQATFTIAVETRNGHGTQPNNQFTVGYNA